MRRTIGRVVAVIVGALVLTLNGGPAWAQTVTVEFGPIEIIQRVGQITVEFGPGEIIEEGGRRTTFMDGGELVFDLSPEILEGEMFFDLPVMEILEGEEMIFYLPRQSVSFEAGDGGSGDGGGDGGGGGGPDCGPTGCGG